MIDMAVMYTHHGIMIDMAVMYTKYQMKDWQFVWWICLSCLKEWLSHWNTNLTKLKIKKDREKTTKPIIIRMHSRHIDTRFYCHFGHLNTTVPHDQHKRRPVRTICDTRVDDVPREIVFHRIRTSTARFNSDMQQRFFFVCNPQRFPKVR